MAPSSSKSYLSRLYKQTKKKTSTKKSRKQSASDVIPHDDFDEKEKTLRQFDMNIAYGPCVGISRLERWERAKALGLDSPQEVFDLLKSGQVQQQSLWKKT